LPAEASAEAGARPRLVVGITGASGAPYAVRLVECAVRAGRRVHLIITPAGRLVLADEAGLGGSPASAEALAEADERHAFAKASAGKPDLASLWPPEILAEVTYTPAEELSAAPASGSFDAEAMVVIPCSMNTLAALSHGLASNLLQRAGAVALKEGRPLVVVPREMPLTRIDIENMMRLAAAGAHLAPAMPAFYHHPKSVADLVDFVVAKILGLLGIEHDLEVDWPGGNPR
jgi:4-hydroxy-3-polyprenylbenzoate decarboxylase